MGKERKLWIWSLLLFIHFTLNTEKKIPNKIQKQSHPFLGAHLNLQMSQDLLYGLYLSVHGSRSVSSPFPPSTLCHKPGEEKVWDGTQQSEGNRGLGLLLVWRKLHPEGWIIV